MTFDPFYVTARCNLWHLPVIFVPCCHANRSGSLSVPAQVPVAWLMMENWVGPGNKASVFQHSHHKLFTDCFCLALLFLQYILKLREETLLVFGHFIFFGGGERNVMTAISFLYQLFMHMCYPHSQALQVHRLQYEFPAEFCTASNKHARPGNEATHVYLCFAHSPLHMPLKNISYKLIDCV